MTSIRKLFATNLKSFRSELGFTQSRLAELADTATHYIAMIEGCKSFPSPEMIEKLAAALGKDSTDLFAITPVQQNWKEAVLVDIENLIANRLNKIRKNQNTTDITDTFS